MFHVPAHKQAFEESRPAQFTPGEPAAENEIKPYGDLLVSAIDDALRVHNMPTMTEIVQAAQINDAERLIQAVVQFNQRIRLLNRTGGVG